MQLGCHVRSEEELKLFNNVHDNIQQTLVQWRKKELHDTDTQIDEETERTWQDWISQPDGIKSRALIQMREQIEEQQMNRAPCAAEWKPGKRFRRDQPPRTVRSKASVRATHLTDTAWPLQTVLDSWLHTAEWRY